MELGCGGNARGQQQGRDSPAIGFTGCAPAPQRYALELLESKPRIFKQAYSREEIASSLRRRLRD